MKKMKKQILRATSALLASAMLFTTSCKKTTSSFTVDSATPWVGQVVNIKDGLDAKAVKKSEIAYDFGDGTESNALQNPSHVYEKVGTYTITQQVEKEKFEGHTGSSASSNQVVTVQMVVPTISVLTSSLVAGQPVSIKNTTNESSNMGYTPTYNLTVTNPSGVTQTIAGSGTYGFVPQSNGSYVINLVATQGQSQATVSQTISVGGISSASSIQGNLAGTWNVAVKYTPNWTLVNGSACGLTLEAASSITSAVYSSITIGSDGSSVTGVVAIPTAQAGNISSLGSITAVDATHIIINPNLFNMGNLSATILSGGNYWDSFSITTAPTGVYVVTSSTPNSIVLTCNLTESDTDGSSCNSNTVSVASKDVYTITLTR